MEEAGDGVLEPLHAVDKNHLLHNKVEVHFPVKKTRVINSASSIQAAHIRY
jgi:hypothetical protein